MDIKQIEKDYFLPHEFDEENEDFCEYLSMIYENWDNLYFTD